MNTATKSQTTKTITWNCPVCRKNRMHYRRVNAGMETLICSQCGHEQHYVYHGTQPEEE